MTVSTADKTGEATRAAAEGQVALNAGDTALARVRYDEAGKILEGRIASTRKQSEKHYLRFLAASQYYRGGNYRKAEALCRKIQADLLPADVRELYPPFRKDVGRRCADDYATDMSKLIQRHCDQEQYQAIIKIFQEHPYIKPPREMALLRARCCEKLRDYRAAALFYRDAWSMGTLTPALIFLSEGFVWELMSLGELAEASKCIAPLLEQIPHAVTYMNASLLRYYQATKSDTEKKWRELTDEQLQYFEEAWKRYQELSPEMGNNSDFRYFMTLCMETAAFSTFRLGNVNRAIDLCNLAIQFNPLSSEPRTIRGILTFPNKSAIDDFREAIRLGERDYRPYVFLAHYTFEREEYQEANSWCEQALARHPNPRIEAQLLTALAIVRAQLGSRPNEIQSLFDRARELDPKNPWIEENWETFHASVKSGTTMPPRRWEEEKLAEVGEDYLRMGFNHVRQRREELEKLHVDVA